MPIHKEHQPVKECPYCDWKTIDVNNRSAAYQIHILHNHANSIEEHLQAHPEDIPFFKSYTKEKERKKEMENPDNFVVCPMCGEKMKRITMTHLFQHDIFTMQEFRDKYPDTPILSKNENEKFLEVREKGRLNMPKRQYSSYPERDIRAFIEELGFKCETNRQYLVGKELDIVVEEKKIAIEFDGLYWHSEWKGHKTPTYHLEKTDTCEKLGYQLIHVFEDEYMTNPDALFAQIFRAVGRFWPSSIFTTDNGVIDIISTDETKAFITEQSTLQYVPCPVNFGFYIAEELMAVISFKEKDSKAGLWTLHNFVMAAYTKVSDILQHFIQTLQALHNVKTIKTIANRRWVSTLQNDYLDNGFKPTKIIPPVPAYVRLRNGDFKRYSEQEIITENPDIPIPFNNNSFEQLKNKGFDRIWDCGYIEYTLDC